jgi:hypothetical protein
MRYPKCGKGKLVKQIDQFTNKETGRIFCDECHWFISPTVYRELVLHQQRLDKVLSKTSGYINDYITINYTNGQFYLLTADEIAISLATVESLLKDIESN